MALRTIPVASQNVAIPSIPSGRKRFSRSKTIKTPLVQHPTERLIMTQLYRRNIDTVAKWETTKMRFPDSRFCRQFLICRNGPALRRM
jgi:hypothetical protein